VLDRHDLTDEEWARLETLLPDILRDVHATNHATPV
jgi:transposase